MALVEVGRVLRDAVVIVVELLGRVRQDLEGLRQVNESKNNSFDLIRRR